MPAKMKNVLVALEFHREPLFEGIAEYARTHNWHLSLEMFLNPANIPWGWNGDGILTMLIQDDPILLKFLRRSRKPIVNLEGRKPTTSYPRVLSDTRQAATMAFSYFRGKGFKHFAFYGIEQSFRGRDFIAVVEENGHECGTLYESPGFWRGDSITARNWLEAQPKPLAVLCWSDYAGACFIDMALSLGWQIPSDIAVLGMDNEELICDCTAVRLSSIRTDIQRVGYQGAALLDRLMSGRKAPKQTQIIPPRDIEERASTTTFAVESPLVAHAIQFMRAHYSSAINVADVVAACRVSRRGLEKAFLSNLGQTPHQALLHIRMEQARTLLKNGTDKIATIAQQVGITDSKHFATLFRAAHGVPPRQYRNGGDAVS